MAAVFAADLPRLWVYGKEGIWYNVGRNEDVMGLVKTRRLMAMQKQQRAKAGLKPPMKKGGALSQHLHKSGGKPAADLPRQTVFNVLYNIKTTGK